MNDSESSQQNTPPILSVEQIHRRIGGKTLLGGVALHLRAGERLAIVGPSGSGKTLLLRTLAMLDPVDKGEIRWQSETIEGHQVPEFRSRVVYLHQRPALIEGTVEENLRYPFSLKVHSQRRFGQDKIFAWLDGLGREHSFLDKRASELSGGEAQIMALLRAIQLEPDVLLLDEPTAALDQDASQAVESLVSRWLSECPGTRATVWVSHDRRQAERLADRVLEMQHGRLSEVL